MNSDTSFQEIHLLILEFTLEKLCHIAINYQFVIKLYYLHIKLKDKK